MQLDKSDHDLLIEIYTKLEQLVGNGQPGTIARMEARIDSLESDRDQMKGAKWALGAIAAAVGGVVSATLEWFYHHHA